MLNNPNWDDINRCPIWKTLGVTECDCCSGLIGCWGADSQLPEPERTYPAVVCDGYTKEEDNG
uniref:Uncharacterized protein n=1 Tax=viral metagenome TaxID=1070528 RepID=A0A6H2A674_9ZZZZ